MLDSFSDTSPDLTGELAPEFPTPDTATSDISTPCDSFDELEDSFEESDASDWDTPEAESWRDAFQDVDDQSAAQAADYARSLGFDRAADYIQAHYQDTGERFEPGEPIHISTRNQDLEGLVSDNGVPFERRTVNLSDDLKLEGVFPNFDSRHQVELGEDAKDMSLYQQFNACKEDFQLHMFDSPEKLSGLTVGDMERLMKPTGYAPEGFTWQHEPETGRFLLVRSSDHSIGHTGGNAFWGPRTKGPDT